MITPEVKALQRKMDQARKNASHLNKTAEADAGQAPYWRNLAAQVTLIADEIEEKILRIQHSQKAEPLPSLGPNVIRFPRRAA